MRKNILIVSILCLLCITTSYTYSAFKNTIKGNITATTNKWKFSVNVPNGVVEEDYYKVPINNSSGTFNIILDNTGSLTPASYIINLEKVNLPDDFIINNSKYEGILNSESKTINVTYSSSSVSNGYIYVKARAIKSEYALMKNFEYIEVEEPTVPDIPDISELPPEPMSYTKSMIIRNNMVKSEFWNENYSTYIKTIIFGNDLSDMPGSCTEENLCWDVSNSSTQKNKVYGYLLDSGETDESSNTLYNLYIVSNVPIYAPSNCSYMFENFYNLVSIVFNNNFYTSDVEDMSYMFYYTESLTNLDLSNFNTSKVTDMSYMFYYSSITSLDLSKFNMLNVKNMNYMFAYDSILKNLNLGDFYVSDGIIMENMFLGCNVLTATINITNAYISNYDNIFLSAANESDSQITVNYINSASTLVDNMLTNKSSDSNVVKGKVLSEPIITIEGNSDIVYESANRLKGTNVNLTSLSGNNFVSSFKMNGILIDGNIFTMPDSNVTITDITTVSCVTFETEHYPYQANQYDIILGEQTFEGATSLKVILDYQFSSGEYANSSFTIYDSKMSTIKRNVSDSAINRTRETITLSGNYIKITFTSESSIYNCYGLKAIIMPNY